MRENSICIFCVCSSVFDNCIFRYLLDLRWLNKWERYVKFEVLDQRYEKSSNYLKSWIRGVPYRESVDISASYPGPVDTSALIGDISYFFASGPRQCL